MKLTYKATTPTGRIVQGVMDAKDIQEAAYFLRAKELLPIRLEQEKAKETIPFVSYFNRLTTNDLVLFTRQLSSMLTAGLTLTQALDILKDQIQNEGMKEVVSSIISDVQEGKALSTAIQKYPQLFSHVYISLIKAAESSGFLDKVLLRLADNLEKEQKLRSTIRGALTYPVIIVILMVVVMGVMMIFVIPQLTVLYSNLNIPLPLPTQIVVGLSNIVIIFWPFLIGLGVVLFVLYKRWKKTDSGELIHDSLILKIPVFGNLIKKRILTEFSRTFGLLIGAGTLVVESLNESAEVAGNRIYKTAIIDIAKRVEKGVTIGDAISAYPIFPPMIVQMVKIGEQTGNLDESLLKVSEYFEREVEGTVKTLTTAMEPFIMIILGIAVAFLIISIITPIYNLTSSIQ
ncbi:MAG TPA: type II secretion system F family protein [Patescibacteria group bacterium]|nr:type II secretion system F family protein [Patescibacteria group bacterium]